MSKAFTKDDDAPEPIPLPARPPLPDGVPNYVTARGLRLLQEELAALDAERARVESAGGEALERRRALARVDAQASQVAERLSSSLLVPPAARGTTTVRFGAIVVVRAADGSEITYRIVGVDEADPARGDIAFTSPIARALLGKAEGDEVTVSAPKGEQELTIVSVEPGREA